MKTFYIALVAADPAASIEVETMLQKVDNVNLTIFRNSDSYKEYLNTTTILPNLVIIDFNLEGLETCRRGSRHIYSIVFSDIPKQQRSV